MPGKPLESGAVGVVRASKSQHFKEAEVVTGLLPWATHLVLDDKQQVGGFVVRQDLTCAAAAQRTLLCIDLK